MTTNPSLWAHDFEAGGIYYNIIDADNKTVEVTYRGESYLAPYYSGSVTIPASVTYGTITYSITSIGEYAFFACEELTSVTIGNSVTTIGNLAFEDCTE